MSSWTTPVTWTNGAVTAATMNTEVKDHLNFIKGALDLLTASTTADTGTTMYVDVRRGSATDPAFRSGASGAANPEFQIDRNGKMSWGPGGGTAVDTFLTRATATALHLTGDSLIRSVWASENSDTYFAGRGGADTNDRIRLSTDASGYPMIRFGNGTGTFRDVYYEPSTSQLFFGTAGAAFQNADVYVTTGNRFAVVGSTAGYIGLAPMASNLSEVRFHASDTASYIARTATGRLQATGRWAAVDGLTMKTKAGTLGDGDFTATAESGLTGLDTTNELLYVRVGTTWRAADLDGGVTTFGPFGWTNLAASSTNLTGSFGALAEGVASTVRPTFAGSIVGLAVRGSAVITAGGASAAVFRPQIGGSSVGLSVTLDSTTNTLANEATQAPGVDTFTGTSAIGCVVTTSGTFAPTTNEYSAVIFVVMHRW